MGPFFDEGTGRPSAVWRLVVQYCTYRVIVSLAVNLLVVAWLMVRSGGESPSGGLDISVISGSPALPLVGGFAGLVGAILSVWLAGRFLDRRPFKDFGFHLSAGWWLDLLFGMALGALLISAVFLVELGLGWVRITGALETFGTGSPFALAFLFPVAVFLCEGVTEETIFRGYQLRNAAEGLGGTILGPRGAVLLAWVLSSVFFGALHADNPDATALSTFNIVLAGLMLGFGYVLSGELAIPIGLHVTWNLFQGTVYGLPVSGFGPFGATFLSTKQGGPDLWTGGSFGPEGGLLVPVALLLGCLLIALWVRLRTGGISPHSPIAERPHRPQSTPR